MAVPNASTQEDASRARTMAVGERPVRMWAVVQERYGQPTAVLQLRQIEVPVLRDDEVLIHVHASSATPADWIKVTGQPWDGCRWFYSDRDALPEMDLEVVATTEQGLSETRRYTLRPLKFSGPLELVALPT